MSAIAGALTDQGAVDAGAILGGLGFVGLAIGFLVGALAFALYLRPDHHAGLGIAILILSVLSAFGGGGFLLGLVFGIVGGILAIRFDYDEYTTPGSYLSDFDGGPRVRPSYLEFDPVGRPFDLRACPNCRRSVDARLAICPGCESPLRPAIPAPTVSAVPTPP